MNVTTYLVLFSLLISTTNANILVLGDSHTVGPFGINLQKNLAKMYPERIILTYAHSSSAPIHWWDDRMWKLSGGVSHRLSYKGKNAYRPGGNSYDKPAVITKLMPVLDQVLIHRHWRAIAPQEKPEVIVFALGANDKRAVSTNAGNRTVHYERRQKILTEILDEVEARGIKCLWVAPPSSSKRSAEMEQTTHNYLTEVIKNRCPIYDSRKFRAVHCDRVHFNCRAAFKTAEIWASEVSDFISDNL